MLPGPGFPVGNFELLPPWVVTSVSPGPGGPETWPSLCSDPKTGSENRGSPGLRPPSCQGSVPVSAVFILGQSLPDSAEPKRGLPWGFLCPDGGGKPALPR